MPILLLKNVLDIDGLTAKRDDPDADTSKPEAEIDRLVYELYGLSEEEVGIVEGSVG